jgi:hypothetical protein
MKLIVQTICCSREKGHLGRKILYNLDVEYTLNMLTGLQILLLTFMISTSATLAHINLVDAATEDNSTSGGTSPKNEDVFALLELEKDVAKHEGSLKDLHSGEKSPFDLLGEVKNKGKFKPESGSFLPEFDDTLKGNGE